MSDLTWGKMQNMPGSGQVRARIIGFHGSRHSKTHLLRIQAAVTHISHRSQQPRSHQHDVYPLIVITDRSIHGNIVYSLLVDEAKVSCRKASETATKSTNINNKRGRIET